MQVPSWVAPIGTAVTISIIMPFIKDAALEWWKRRLAGKVEQVAVQVAEIEATQGREVRVSSEVWQFVDELKDEIAALREQISAQNMEIDGLRGQLATMRSITAENARLRKRVKSLETKLAIAQNEKQGRRTGDTQKGTS